MRRTHTQSIFGLVIEISNSNAGHVDIHNIAIIDCIIINDSAVSMCRFVLREAVRSGRQVPTYSVRAASRRLTESALCPADLGGFEIRDN